MRSLISIVRDVLNGVSEIPELPDGQLVAYEDIGRPFPGVVDRDLVFKIARLQTLIVSEKERAEMPRNDATEQLCQETGQDFTEVYVNAKEVCEDAFQNVLMLERLIVGLVREACPQESDRLGVRYLADISCRIYFAPELAKRPFD